MERNRRSYGLLDRSERRSRRTIFYHGCILLTSASLCSSCSFFSRPPPLPRHAAIESTIAADEEFTALVQNADIIYFPSESVTLTARTEAVWKLLEALQRTGDSFALGWDLIGGEEQPLLDRWAKRQAAASDVIPRLHLRGAADGDENCRAFLREANRSGAQILGLSCPPELLSKKASGSTSASPAKEEISREFQPPSGDFERFAQRPSSRGVNEAKLRAAYEAKLLAEEFAAARIAGYFREHRSEKILVFARRDQLGRHHGVPYFVAQKTKARQLVLNSQNHPPPRSRLFARN